ncbi:MAG: hypothetical protein CBE24_04935 [bacterium TMED264]|nr:MAG: hypothetical protein CBE24_04935 [bacterium TMED264]
MSPIRNEEILDVAVEASLAASNIIMEAAHNPQIVRVKKSRSDLVTHTDLESERIIKSFISKTYPNHNILAEESDQNDNSSEYLWVIDPLDGTTNFVHGYPSYSVSIGVYYKNKPIVAVVLEMPHVKLYTAIKNKGSWCEGNKIQASKTINLKDSLLVTGFGYQHGDLWAKNMDLFKIFTDKCHGVRRLGSASIDICHVATGQVDGFWEYDLSPWDSAAGILIAEEAGCLISQLNGTDYNILKNNILVTNGIIHKEMVEEFKNYLN